MNVDPTATTAGLATIGVGRAVMTPPGRAPRHGLPGVIPTDELLFWTRRWREGEGGVRGVSRCR